VFSHLIWKLKIYKVITKTPDNDEMDSSTFKILFFRDYHHFVNWKEDRV